MTKEIDSIATIDVHTTWTADAPFPQPTNACDSPYIDPEGDWSIPADGFDLSARLANLPLKELRKWMKVDDEIV